MPALDNGDCADPVDDVDPQDTTTPTCNPPDPEIGNSEAGAATSIPPTLNDDPATGVTSNSQTAGSDVDITDREMDIWISEFKEKQVSRYKLSKYA